jgi:FkbM family methyltransferase
VLRKIRSKLHARRIRSTFVRTEGYRSLYRTRTGDHFWLDPERWLDQSIIKTGVHEPESSRAIEALVGPGQVVFDIGANIGYFAIAMSRLVGEKGRVIAFEPTVYYGEVLTKNLEENEIRNCEIVPYGLSSEEAELTAYIGDSSATLHWWLADTEPRESEPIRLQRLDDIVDGLDIDRIDFIKMDIDGHEPFFFEGAWEALNRFRPRILMEVSAPYFLDTGISPADIYDMLIEHDLHIYSEKTMEEFENKLAFLYECGNYVYSANVIVSWDELDKSDLLRSA